MHRSNRLSVGKAEHVAPAAILPLYCRPMCGHGTVRDRRILPTLASGLYRMHTDFFAWLEQHKGREYDLHTEHINPAFVKMLRAIGFDKGYVRGEGCYLWDAEGNKYLDLLTGWGVFALGRNHPKVKAILQQVIGQDMPNLVRMDCSLLSGWSPRS